MTHVHLRPVREAPAQDLGDLLGTPALVQVALKCMPATRGSARLVATNALIGTFLVPVAYAVAGPLAEAIGVRSVLAACALIVLGGAAIAACSHDVRQLVMGT
ncbi:hypothetical protein GCM10009733_103440 [Nonomuraea maheshkhaliensis]|uniref:MFS transporter n=1 Tax=Nonomuraea maheshkhaliensis TaxID=419590 RepID=A0ABP4TMX6_9ACTN